jgi:hypothetical protein
MAVWLWICALGVQAEVCGKEMNESSLRCLHGLETETLLIRSVGKDAELTLLSLRPLALLREYVESVGRIRNVISSIDMRTLVDVERQCKLSVAFEPGTLLITR